MDIFEKCALLESLGFEIEHEDSRVSVPRTDMVFDFSATNPVPEDIIYVAVVSAYVRGKDAGKAEMQEDIKKLLNIA